MNKPIIILIVIFILLSVLAVLETVNFTEKCKEQGGVIVHNRIPNCWKDNGFIEIK